jgi:hypothetical protein
LSEGHLSARRLLHRNSRSELQSELHDPLLGRLGSGQDALQSAFVHHHNPVGQTDELRVVRKNSIRR